MTPYSLRLYRFGSFLTEQRFNFPDKPGLYFIEGDNRSEPRLGSNGAGKSTIFAALTWCLFGKNPDNLIAGDVANWLEAKGMWVEFTYGTHAEDMHVVRRSHSPNTWTLTSSWADDPDPHVTDLAKDEANELLADLKLEFTPFLNCILMAQEHDMFLDLKSGPQAALFADVMALDKWNDYVARAAKKSAIEDVKVYELKGEAAHLRGQLLGMEGDLDASIDRWNRAKLARLHTIDVTYQSALADSKVRKEAKGRAEEAEDLANQAVRKGNDYIEDLRGRERGSLDRMHQADIEAKHAGTVVRELEKQLAGMDLNVCNACGQVIPRPAREDFAKVRAMFESAIEHEKACLSASKIHASDARELADEVTEARRTADEARTVMETARRTLTDARASYELVERDLDRLEDAAELIEKEVNPYVEVQRAADVLRTEVQRKLEVVLTDLGTSSDRYEMLGFWIRGYKDIRLGLISEALEELAIEVNSCVTALGLVDWSLEFEVDRETKSGSISRGFNVYVRSPHNDKQVPWSAWSGGEAQRLRIAGQMGLSDLIRARTGATLPLEVWDEPDEGMTPQGVRDLLDALADRARFEQRQVFVISHRSLDYGRFDKVYTVIKDEHGSRFATED